MPSVTPSHVYCDKLYAEAFAYKKLQMPLLSRTRFNGVLILETLEQSDMEI